VTRLGWPQVGARGLIADGFDQDLLNLGVALNRYQIDLLDGLGLQPHHGGARDDARWRER